MKRLLVSLLLNVGLTLASACSNAPDRAAGPPAENDDAGISSQAQIAAAEGSFDLARERLERLPADSVKTLYLACSADATGQRLGTGAVAFCSVVYDVLLTRHFGGDFGSLLAWSRQQPAATSGLGSVGAGRESATPEVDDASARQRWL